VGLRVWGEKTYRGQASSGAEEAGSGLDDPPCERETIQSSNMIDPPWERETLINTDTPAMNAPPQRICHAESSRWMRTCLDDPPCEQETIQSSNMTESVTVDAILSRVCMPKRTYLPYVERWKPWYTQHILVCSSSSLLSYFQA